MPLALRSGWTFAVLSLIVLAWLVVIYVPGMSSGTPDLVGFALFMGVWTVGMAAMMLPSTIPIVSLLSRNSEAEGVGTPSNRSLGDPAQFLLGYLGVWSLIGVLAFLGSQFVMTSLSNPGGINGFAGLASGAAVFLAGAYQLSPLKQKALEACRSPMTFVLARWRTGALGRILMGADYSSFCTRCCWALMAILVLVALMSLPWMIFFAGVIYAEKVLPHGVGFSKGFGLALMASGAVIAGIALF